jgi:hypothetical protein
MVPVPFSGLFFIFVGSTYEDMPDMIAYLIVFAFGFAAGYGVREQVSRKRRREAVARRGF